jgi:uncharacterized alpha-E superfamily protein
MLSRVAENLFWIARYIERAESTSRLLDVNYYATLEGGNLVQEQWSPLLIITGGEKAFAEHHPKADSKSVPFWLAFDLYNPSSIRSNLTQARENARALRDRISSEMWECINKAYHELCFDTDGVMANDALHEYCNRVRETSHLFFGIALSTLLRDEGWQFLRLGQLIERADNLLRILQVRYQQTGTSVVAEALENHRWMALLKTVSAYEAYRKRYHTKLEPQNIAEFLLLDSTFPRSVTYAIEGVRDSLKKLPNANAIKHETNWLIARLEHGQVSELLQEEALEKILEDVNAIGAMVQSTYFHLNA